MGKKKKPLPLIEGVEICDMAAEGKALARVEDMVVFVPFGAPGDIVDIQLFRKRKSYAEGRILKFQKYSPKRIEPVCEHFTDCGGCKWQHIPYEMQLLHKQKEVKDNLTRIGKISLPEISPIVGSEQIFCYRNKLEFTFSAREWLPFNRFNEKQNESENTESLHCNSDDKHKENKTCALGFHIPGMFDKVLDIRKCWLQDDISNRIRLFVKDFCISNNYSFFDLKAQIGMMRTLIIRTSSTGEVMLIVAFHEDDYHKRNHLLEAIKTAFPEITSLMYVINNKLNDTITDLEIITYNGKDYLTEQMEDLQFRVGPKSFYQTNSRQAYRLYSIVREFAGLTGSETVYDLYTGTGTIANFIARQCLKVIGIEYVNEAIEDAKINSEINSIANTEFYAGDMKDILNQEFIATHGSPDVIITDPPRTGMHDDVTESILAAAPQRIVYVSCNPATQARDLSRLDAKYRVTRVQPVDMFPHTHHVENVVLLERISNSSI
ncbi:MAG: 23S rRNA (uracil(1939)-C(5))-methyltransferase RlmD [Bacteroidales bacterium]|nr:23S rRNA (uracil(1939)-C(5))-methyltransferase RlmD [Bacteroidales bacterium]